MAFDVGAITRELQTDFRLFAAPTRAAVAGETGNRATPENLSVLVQSLENLTRATEDARADQIDGWLPDIGVVIWDTRHKLWKDRLAKYKSDLAKAPPGDREDVLWSVTAPLLIGYFGGPDSTDPQKPIDAITPFSLANQLEVAAAWQEERWRLMQADLAKAFKDAAAGLGGGALLIGAVALIALALWRR